ncbi:C6 zinc finger protein [Xylariaceae sp. FL1272]|nr:C6 zinc finger protein [Xylariaceae sp. FL1272]
MNPLDFTQSAPLPILTLGDGNTDFDYGAYLQEDDIDYLADSGSSGSVTAMNEALSPGTSPLVSSVVEQVNSRKPRLERRGHTKSRRGCYNCKRRRIKCQETHPACGHCVKTGLKCEYPIAPQVTHQPQHQIPLFSLQDMRFFQHFLLACYPHHPLGNRSIWTHDVPCLSQNYEYLMHAILGLAASDLMTQDPSLVTFAMGHRLKAIKAIKKTLTDVSKRNAFEEGNALIATCFALTFQSVCLDDGMVEFMTFCRGIVIVAIQMYCKGAKFIFANIMEKDELAVLQPLMEALPPIRSDWTDMAVASIAELEPLCREQVEVDYQRFLADIAKELYTSPFGAYQVLCKHYGWWMQIPHEDFRHVIDSENQVCLLLASHWIALKQIMATITETEHQAKNEERRKEGDTGVGMIRWLRYLNRQIDVQHQEYNQWPLWVERQLNVSIGYFGKLCGGIER